MGFHVSEQTQNVQAARNWFQIRLTFKQFQNCYDVALGLRWLNKPTCSLHAGLRKTISRIPKRKKNSYLKLGRMFIKTFGTVKCKPIQGKCKAAPRREKL